jgi:hypothetical protein
MGRLPLQDLPTHPSQPTPLHPSLTRHE